MTAKTPKPAADTASEVPASAAVPDGFVVDGELLVAPADIDHADKFPLHVLPGAKTQKPNGLVLESY